MPSRLTIERHAIQAVSTWTVGQVRTALLRHEEGEFELSAQLARSAERDPRVYGCITSRTDALTAKSGFDRYTTGPDRKTRGTVESEYVKRQRAEFDQWVTTTTLKALHRDYVHLGVCVGWIEWLRRPGYWKPRLRHLPVDYLTWSETSKRFEYTAQNGLFEVAPGDGNWFLIADPEPGRAGAIRALGERFIGRSWAHRDWNRFNERHGFPIIKLFQMVGEQFDALRDKFKVKLQRLGVEGVMRFPRLMVGDRVEQEDAQLMESSGANWQTFESYLSTSAADVAITLLGQNLTTEVKGGSYAAAQAHQEVKRELVAADAERFQTALREQLTIPWGSYNWEGFSPEDAPWELWRTEAESDRAREGQVLVSVVDSVAKARIEGIELDLEQVADKTGWKVRLGEKPEPPVQQPPRTPGAAPSGSKTKALQEPEEDAEGCSHAFDPTMATQQPDADAWQDYALRVGDDLANEGARALAPTLAAVLRAISQADSFEDALARMEAAYASVLTPDELIELTTSGLVMAQSAGIQGEEDDFNAQR